jgi:acetyl-CoA carboxylase beta subunit
MTDKKDDTCKVKCPKCGEYLYRIEKSEWHYVCIKCKDCFKWTIDKGGKIIMIKQEYFSRVVYFDKAAVKDLEIISELMGTDNLSNIVQEGLKVLANQLKNIKEK